MKKRKSEIERKTKETEIKISLNIDGKGCSKIKTSLPFLDHMLELFSKHSGVDLEIKASGDTEIDEHHLVEDLGIVMGQAIEKALKDKKGIYRYGNFLLPMDESLSYVAIDLGGRFYLSYEVPFKPQSKAPFCFELFEDFFEALAANAKMNLHIHLIRGRNNHHIAESVFKGFAKAFSQAISCNKKSKGIPSTKGKL